MKYTCTVVLVKLASRHNKLLLVFSPDLTWRDLQHIIVRTAKPAALKARDWKVNGVGRKGSSHLPSTPPPLQRVACNAPGLFDLCVILQIEFGSASAVCLRQHKLNGAHFCPGGLRTRSLREFLWARSCATQASTCCCSSESLVRVRHDGRLGDGADGADVAECS